MHIDIDYDDSQRITTVAAYKGAGTATPLRASRYTYVKTMGDGVDRETDLRQTVGDLDGGRTTYQYDALNRLVDAKVSGGPRDGQHWQYAYDPAGNVLRQQGTGVDFTNTYGPMNEILTRAASGATAEYRYDLKGNLTGAGFPRNLDFGYNTAGQTNRMSPFDGQSDTTLQYLGDGQNVLTGIGAARVRYSSLGILSRTDASGTIRYTRGPDGSLLRQRTPGGSYDYLQDALGSIVGQTDASGDLAAGYRYDPYGTTTENTGSAPNHFGYAGGHKLPNGLYHFGARFYDPTDLRWTQPDPLDQTGDLLEGNKYAYVGGNPINLTDPTGLHSTAGCGNPQTYTVGGQSVCGRRESAREVLSECATGAGYGVAADIATRGLTTGRLLKGAKRGTGAVALGVGCLLGDLGSS